MTRGVETDYDRREPMMRWITDNPRLGSLPDQAALSVQNLDAVVHRYIVCDSNGNDLHRNHLMLLETKCCMAKSDRCQQDTFRKLNLLLRSVPNGTVTSTRGRGREDLFYHGMHLLQLSSTTPDDSETMCWDYKPITAEQLVQLLRFEIDAYTLLPREDVDGD